MIAVSKLEMFRVAVHEGDDDEALPLADLLVDAMGAEAPTEVFEYLDCIAEQSQVGAFLCAKSLAVRAPNKRKRRMKLLRAATKGEDDDIAGTAYYIIAAEHLSSGKLDKVIPNLESAARLGHGDAHIRISHARETGEFDNDINLEYAFDILTLAVEDLNYGPAKVELADFILRNQLDHTRFDVPTLLHDALHDGVPGAAERLMAVMLDVDDDEDDDDRDAETIRCVVPDGMTRIVAARDAIRNELDSESGVSEALVAYVHGFPNWDTLTEAANDPDAEKGPFDEDVAPQELESRRRAQMAIIRSFIMCNEPVAGLLLDLLAPTSRDGTPSLRRLAEMTRKLKDAAHAKPVGRRRRKRPDSGTPI